MASGDSVQQIKDRLSIVDVITPYVELHKAGRHFKGKSPFTNEKTPSFFVSPDRGMYYCFSTSKGGDMFTFVQELEGVDFKGALTILADKAGVELVPEDPQKRTERDTLHSAMEAATAFYEAELPKTPVAVQYLNDRGVTKETLAKWRIGYAPGPPDRGWREIGTYLQSKNFVSAMLVKAGLTKTSEQGKEPYDVFRDRIMFPISDPSGRVIAFSGRILNKDSEAPKYVNSPETDLFNKSEALYGYSKAKEGIRKYDFSLIVEGQFDVVLAHQAGYNNAVAVSGTAMTDYHAALLQRLSNRVVLALDADRAGIAAVKRAADLMLVRGMDVKVARIPDGQDPADIIKADPKQFKELIGHSTHVIEFLLDVLKATVKDERTFKLQARDEVVPYLLRLQNHIDRDHFEQKIADVLKTSKDAVHLEVIRLEEKKSEKSTAPKSVGTVMQEKQVVQFTTRKDGYLHYLLIAASLAEEKLALKLREEISELLEVDFDEAVAAIPPGSSSELLFTLEADFATKSPEEIEREIRERLHQFALLVLREKITAEKESLFKAERSNDSAAVESSLSRVTELQKKLASITG